MVSCRFSEQAGGQPVAEAGSRVFLGSSRSQTGVWEREEGVGEDSSAIMGTSIEQRQESFRYNLAMGRAPIL